MDNKITKKRLSDFLSYEWILILIVTLVSIVALEVLYSINRVKPTVGQSFKVIFDENVASENIREFKSRFLGVDQYSNGQIFSYDVLEANAENMNEEYNILSTRLQVQDADVVLTDSLENQKGSSRAKTIVDSFGLYSLDDLANDSCDYLSKFLKGEFSAKSTEEKRALVLDKNNFDADKIKGYFRSRMAKDNRFRSELQKLKGEKLEIERIENLSVQTKKFIELLNSDQVEFFEYKRYEQVLKEFPKQEGKEYEDLKAQVETTAKKYGIMIGSINRERADKHFSSPNGNGEYTAEKTVLGVFNFKNEQPDHQFEAISFINGIVDYLLN